MCLANVFSTRHNSWAIFDEIGHSITVCYQTRVNKTESRQLNLDLPHPMASWTTSSLLRVGSSLSIWLARHSRFLTFDHSIESLFHILRRYVWLATWFLHLESHKETTAKKDVWGRGQWRNKNFFSSHRFVKSFPVILTLVHSFMKTTRRSSDSSFSGTDLISLSSSSWGWRKIRLDSKNVNAKLWEKNDWSFIDFQKKLKLFICFLIFR